MLDGASPDAAAVAPASASKGRGARRGIEAAELGPVEQQRPAAVVVDAKVEHTAQHDLMVAGVVHKLEPAVHPCQHSFEAGGSARCGRPCDAGELVPARDGEAPTELLLGLAQHV